MGNPDTFQWTALGRTANASYYTVEPGILAVVPATGSHDTAETARANVEFQNEFFRKSGPGISIVFIDRSAGQDSGARAVYRTGADPSVYLGVAMVGGTLLSRAIASFFLGISKPEVPFKMFSTLDESLGWARRVLAAKRSAED